MIESNRTTKYLDILQIFRGIAALLVVLHHTIGSINYYHNVDNYWLNLIQSIGKFGVDFFFVLSGFIICYTAYFKKNDYKGFKKYLKNRLIRIYVPYLPVGILMLVLYTYLPWLSNSPRDINLLTSLTLMPAGNPALSVAWTLSYEVIFYILFSLYFLSRRFWVGLASVWCFCIIYFNWIYVDFSTTSVFVNHLLSPYNLEFLSGTVLAFVIHKGYRFNTYFIKFLTCITGFAFLITYAFNFTPLFKFYANILFSIFCLLIIYLSIGYRVIKFDKNNLWMLIGIATFSIYLLHNTIQMIVVRFFPKIILELRVVLMLSLSLILSCVFGYCYYLIFEVRLTNRLRNKL